MKIYPLFSLNIDLRTFVIHGVPVYLNQRDHGAQLHNSICFVGGCLVSAVGSFSMLQLRCPIHLVGCFICILLLFHLFSGVSPHPGLVMHLLIIHHMLLEMLVLYPSYLTSVDTLYKGVGTLVSGRLEWIAPVDRSLSYMQTHAHFLKISVQSLTHTLKSGFWLKQNHVYFCIKCLCMFRYQKGAAIMWKHSRR